MNTNDTALNIDVKPTVDTSRRKFFSYDDGSALAQPQWWVLYQKGISTNAYAAGSDAPEITKWKLALFHWLIVHLS